ncbi:hypothetical protein [Streptomyces poriticola]|uniref:hypothetical protein n=1 Tax=Streptomyces poriticola TaxID=3120506 RepID=UPI002FCE0A63
MAEKIVDVTLAAITNVGATRVSPMGFIQVRTVRAVDDEQDFQRETLYSRERGEPLHPSGAQRLEPGNSLTYNVMRRLTVRHFGTESPGQLNQMLILAPDLTQDFVELGTVHTRVYFGCSRLKIRFGEIEGFQTVSCSHNAFLGDQECKFRADYTVNLVSSSG